MLFNYLEREKTVHPASSLGEKQAAEGSAVAEIIGKMSSGVREWLGCLLAHAGSRWLCFIEVEVLINC